MCAFEISNDPHRRYNPLTDEWILVSPHRAKRPWVGQEEQPEAANTATYDKDCYLCAGNTRVGGGTNPDYTDTFTFDNDHQAIIFQENLQKEVSTNTPLFQVEPVSGTCRVMCFSPNHSETLSHMEIPGIENVIREWIHQTNELKKMNKWVQIFENKGTIMGCSNKHPHCQIWAGDFVPTIVTKEDASQKKYFEEHSSLLLVDYLASELDTQERVVCENDHWAVVVPFWAVWPFETMLLPKHQVAHLNDLSADQQHSLAEIMKKLLMAYDEMFHVSFPYSMGWHGAPFTGADAKHWLLHAHFYPPLLRSASVKKFMVGYEMLAEAQRDITPEQAAVMLRKLVA